MMVEYKKKILPAALIAAPVTFLCLIGSRASADPLDDIFHPSDADGALPMERILDHARGSVPGTFSEIEFETEHGKLLYEVEILTSDSKQVEIEYDARTGAELSREIKNHKAKKED